MILQYWFTKHSIRFSNCHIVKLVHQYPKLPYASYCRPESSTIVRTDVQLTASEILTFVIVSMHNFMSGQGSKPGIPHVSRHLRAEQWVLKECNREHCKPNSRRVSEPEQLLGPKTYRLRSCQTDSMRSPTLALRNRSTMIARHCCHRY